MEHTLLITVLEVVIMAFPSIVTLVVLLNRKFYIKQLQLINTKIEEVDNNNIKRSQELLERVDYHQDVIKSLLTYKTVSDKVRDMTKHAIQYIGDRRLSKIIENSTQQFIDFIVPIIQDGFANISKQQLLAKIHLNRDNSMAYVKKILSSQQYTIWQPMATPIVNYYINSIFDIYDDPVNDKNSRFFIKSQDYIQTLTRQFIKFAAILKYPQHEGHDVK